MTGKKRPEGRPRKRAIEPVTRTACEENRFTIFAEIPEMAEVKIRIDIDGDTVFVSAEDDERRYRKKILLPWRARFAGKRFRGGNLELNLEREEG